MKVTREGLRQFMADNVDRKVKITRQKSDNHESIRKYTIVYWGYFHKYCLEHESGDHSFDIPEDRLSALLGLMTFELL